MDILERAQKKKKKKTRDEDWIVDEESDHPIHEDYIKQGKQRRA